MKGTGCGRRRAHAGRAFAGCGGGEKKADAPAGNSAKIGFITAYTGPGAAYGVAMKEGVDLAVEEINKNPNTKVKIDLYTYDTKLVKNEAINAMKKAIEQDKVLAIEGPMTTGEMMAPARSRSSPASSHSAPAPPAPASPISATTSSETPSPAR